MVDISLAHIHQEDDIIGVFLNAPHQDYHSYLQWLLNDLMEMVEIERNSRSTEDGWIPISERFPQCKVEMNLS